jgi:hypothetical protein
MKTLRYFRLSCAFPCLAFLLLADQITSQEQHSLKDKHSCSEPNPQAICSASNTCGSPSTPCSIDVKRTPYGASVTPSIPGAKENTPFCVKAGTKIIWQSSSKNTGFTVDFGPSSPFKPGEGVIIGGSDRSVSLVARNQGCYKFSVGACIAGAVYGMCAESNADLVIKAPDK